MSRLPSNQELLQAVLTNPQFNSLFYPLSQALMNYEGKIFKESRQGANRYKDFLLHQQLLVKLASLLEELSVSWQSFQQSKCYSQYSETSPYLFSFEFGKALTISWQPDVLAYLRQKHSDKVAGVEALVKVLVIKLVPWRKGPYNFLGTYVDAEWRSDLKWNRLRHLGAISFSHAGNSALQTVVDKINLQDKLVLDVGPGNGYHLWYMLQAGARQAWGIEPYELFNTQHYLTVTLARYADVLAALQAPVVIEEDNLYTAVASSYVYESVGKGAEDTETEEGSDKTALHSYRPVRVGTEIHLEMTKLSEGRADVSQAYSSKDDLRTDVVLPMMIPLPLGVLLDNMQQVQALGGGSFGGLGRATTKQAQVSEGKAVLFDTVFSMGVLYHRPDPQAFLRDLLTLLKPTGQLVLETICIYTDDMTKACFPTLEEEQVVNPQSNMLCLYPDKKYCGMTNVYTVPSKELLIQWLNDLGLENVEVLHAAYTTIEEQRAVKLASPQSLTDFLDPHDLTKTIEGYPAPYRVIISAYKPA